MGSSLAIGVNPVSIFFMARPLRIEYPGAVYFITCIGNANQNVFLDSEDGNSWIEIFDRVCDRFGWICYAFCLMGNRYMIVVETKEPNLSKGMRQLNGMYTQSFNRRHSSSGHLFQGRFKSVHVQKEKYLADLVRYILFLPVHSGFVKLPQQFKWSSCKYLFDREDCPAWVNNKYLKGLYSDPENDFSANNPPDDVILKSIKKQIFLGDEDFISELQKYISKDKDLREIPKIQRAKPISEFVNSSDSKEKAIANAYLSGDYTLQQIADYFSLHYSTISRIVKEFENKKVA
jgi:REP element-mobilizing transposase RayT